MNISHRIREISQQFPDKKSVVFAKDHSFFTFREFEERSNQFANKFIKLGIRPGMRTLLFVKPCLDFSVMTFALFKIGAVPVLIDPGMGIKNLLNSVRQVRPEALVSIGIVHWLRRFKKDYFKNVKIKISLNRVWGETHFIYHGLAQEPKDFEPLKVAPDHLAAILFTSGGTGIPKGVLYTHSILNAQTDALREMFSLNESNVDLPGFPLFALFTLAMGMTSVIPEMDPSKPGKCHPEKLVKNILDYKATFIAGSPAIWERVGEFCIERKIQLPSVKQVVMFGAPVRAEIHQMYKKILIDGDTFTPYGATESLPVSLISGSEILKTHLPKMLQGYGTCIGRPVRGVEIEIIKASDIPELNLNTIPIGEVGEIAVKGPQVTPGYFDMDDETKRSKIFSNGVLWHRMGDLGRKDELGNIWFLGRKTHRVITSNSTFYPIQIESIFNQHPQIKRSALVKLTHNNQIHPALVIERKDHSLTMSNEFRLELDNIKASTNFTSQIFEYFLHDHFPVDVRHNIKIDRLKLASWAQERLDRLKK